MKKKEKLFFGALLIFCAPFLTATVFVIQENGAEVGRWEEPDGTDAVKIIENSVPRETSGSDDNLPETPDGQTPAKTENKETWTFSGRLINILDMSPITRGTLTFSGAAGSIDVPVAWNGSFSVKAPRIQGGGYLISVISQGYQRHVFIAESGFFKKQGYAARLRMYGAVPFQKPLAEHSINLEVGVFPEVLTENQKQDYASAIRGG